MPQKNHKLLVSVDWLSLTLISNRTLTADHVRQEIQEPDRNSLDFKGIYKVSGRFNWVWSLRPYGTKQFRSVWEIALVDEDGVLEPFAVICSEPTSAKIDPAMCTLKVENHFLYRDCGCYWLDALRCFLADYQLRFVHISRCDLAGDFLYLVNRVSGPALVSKIKNLSWWKCGTTKIAEHYTMPYSIKSDNWANDTSLAPSIYLQNQQIAPRVETMTFGTMSSDAQVCIYDKTLELNRSNVEIEINGQSHVESAKEYIRDCHKQAGVWDPKRHTWRIEIRLKSQALFILEPGAYKERAIELADLDQIHIFDTFRAAADRYFKLVDATEGGSQEITPEYCTTMASHKNRLPLVNLFPRSVMTQTFTKKKYHEAANRFHRSVIKRLDELGDRLNRVPCKYSKPGDEILIPSLIERLAPISVQMKNNRSQLNRALDALNNVHSLLSSGTATAAAADIELISQAKEMLERHYNTESPQFVRNIVSMLTRYSTRILCLSQPGSSKSLRQVRSAKPSDSQVLVEAAEILKGIYVDVVNDERRASNFDIYSSALRDSISIVNSCENPPNQVLDLAFEIVESSRFLPESEVAAIVSEFAESDFFQLLRCRWDLELWHRLLHHTGVSSEWRPPLLRLSERRNITSKLTTL